MRGGELVNQSTPKSVDKGTARGEALGRGGERKTGRAEEDTETARRGVRHPGGSGTFGYTASQSSSLKPMIGAKSRRLWVTRIKSCARAVAAIKNSMGGMFSPRLIRSARMRP